MRSVSKLFFVFFFSALLLVFACGCKKFVEITPPDTLLSAGAVFSSDQTATAAMLGVYSRAMAAPGILNGNGLYDGLSADELVPTLAATTIVEFSDDALSSGNILVANMYGGAYNIIYNANTMLENLAASQSLSTGMRNRLTGEALFVRALCYSRLADLFGDVPLELTTNVDENSVTARSTAAAVRTRVIQDLVRADSLIDTSYAAQSSFIGDRTRPNRQAVRALLARELLYQGLATSADSAASLVIESTQYALASSLDSVFIKNSTEAIWQLQPVSPSMNSAEGYFFIPSDNVQARPNYVLSSSLLTAFESGDRRKARWTAVKTIGGADYVYPYKYKVRGGPPYAEYNMVLRLAELYLIRAEARASKGDAGLAAADLNIVRKRAGLALLPSGLSMAQVTTAIAQERRIELFAEWGHRWSDLKRTGRADSILALIKPRWKPTAKLYPIPQIEIQRNPAMSQNPGYQ